MKLRELMDDGAVWVFDRCSEVVRVHRDGCAALAKAARAPSARANLLQVRAREDKEDLAERGYLVRPCRCLRASATP